ncbi:hypothetical protein HCN52_24565, partial [Streptomyces bohaiensis]|nr:hypothetical protein [Streptomyces bohaiensis]
MHIPVRGAAARRHRDTWRLTAVSAVAGLMAAAATVSLAGPWDAGQRTGERAAAVPVEQFDLTDDPGSGSGLPGAGAPPREGDAAPEAGRFAQLHGDVTGERLGQVVVAVGQY